MQRAEEQHLIRQAQDGNREAFASLYQTHVQAIFRYIYHRVNDRQLAEDLTGDVFMRALEGLPRYQESGTPFVAWLYRIAHARVVDHYRRQDRRPTDSDLEAQPLPVETDWDSGLLRQQAADVLRQAISQLTAEQQEVIALRFVEGWSLELVAQHMGKNANAIKALQHRAIRALAQRLQRSGLDMESILAGLSS